MTTKDKAKWHLSRADQLSAQHTQETGFWLSVCVCDCTVCTSACVDEHAPLLHEEEFMCVNKSDSRKEATEIFSTTWGYKNQTPSTFKELPAKGQSLSSPVTGSARWHPGYNPPHHHHPPRPFSRQHAAADSKGHVHRPWCAGGSQRGPEKDSVPENAPGASAPLDGARGEAGERRGGQEDKAKKR